MGDVFIEGVGDEVVLFGGFLVLSLSFLSAATLWQSLRREPNRATSTRSEQPPSRSQQAPDSNQAPRNAEHVQNSTDSEGLRRRFVTGSSSDPPNVDPPNVESPSRRRDDLEQDDTEEVGMTGGPGLEDAEMTIRLVRAGVPEQPMEVCVTPSCTIEHLRQTYFHTELSQECPVRFIYQGRVISDGNMTIGNLNIRDGGAMHVHIGRPRQHGEPSPPQDIDLSRFFLPLLGVILGIVWAGMLCFPYVFSFLTKLFLYALSFGYVVLAYYSMQS